MAGHPSPALTARVIHLALVLGVVVAAAALLALRTAAAAAPAPPVLLPVLVAVAIGTVGGALALKARLPERTAGVGDDAWWAANLGRAVPVWALLEAAGIVGAVFYFIGVGRAGLIVAAAALALLVANGPGRLIDR
jgi:hypothetical protein